MQNETDLLHILLVDMAELECTHRGCTEGVGGAVWKTPALEFANAIQLLDRHLADSHGQQVPGAGGAGGAAGGAGEVQLHRPTFSGGCSQAEFKLFAKKWEQYVRSSGETDDVLLRDQLLNCPDETLGGALYEALDDRADTISVTELLKEIEVLVVVTKGNIVELPKTSRNKDQGVTVTVDEEGRMIILSPKGHSQHSSVETTKPDVAEFNTDMMLRAEFNTDMMLGAEFSTDMMLGAEFEKLSVVKTTCGDKRVHMVHGLPLHEAPDDAKEGGEEVQRGEVPHSVLPPDCSLTQFASFQNAWNHFSEQYKSWHRDESQYVVNYELNYKLLASIPEPLEDEIYRELGYEVETIPTQ